MLLHYSEWTRAGQRPGSLLTAYYLFVLVSFLGDPRVSGVHVVLKKLVLTKRRRADCAFVGEMCRLQSLAVVLGHVVQQLPLVDLSKRVMSDDSVMLVWAPPCRRQDTGRCPAPCWPRPACWP